MIDCGSNTILDHLIYDGFWTYFHILYHILWSSDVFCGPLLTDGVYST